MSANQIFALPEAIRQDQNQQKTDQKAAAQTRFLNLQLQENQLAQLAHARQQALQQLTTEQTQQYEKLLAQLITNGLNPTVGSAQQLLQQQQKNYQQAKTALTDEYNLKQQAILQKPKSKNSAVRAVKTITTLGNNLDDLLKKLPNL